MLIGHMKLDALGALASIANCPHSAVKFAGYVFYHGLIAFYCDIAEQTIGEAKFIGKHFDDRMVRLTFEQRCNYLVAPLERAVRGCYRTTGFKLCRSRQQINTVCTVMHNGRYGWIWVDNHQHI